MAAQPQLEDQPERQQLIAQLARSRAQLAADLDGMLHELDFKSKLGSSFRNHSRAWISGAAITGLALAVIPTRLRGGKRKRGRDQSGGRREAGRQARREADGEHRLLTSGLLMATLKTLFPVVKPVLLALASRRMNSVADRLGKPQ